MRSTATSQIDDYHQRFSKVSRFYDLLLKDLIIDTCKATSACQTARKLFGKDTANFVAIDGTEYSKLMFDMVIFYAGAYSSEGVISFSDEGRIGISYADRFIDRGNDVSSCLPIYINEVPEIDQTFLDLSQSQTDGMKILTDESMLNNSNFSNYLMGFAEIYLAFKYAISKKFDIIFLDRSLSTTYLSLISSTSSRRLWQSYSSILGFEIDGLPVDINDLKIARQNVINEKLDLPPTRGTYLRYTILFALSKLGEEKDNFVGLDIDSICQLLQISSSDKKQNKRIAKYMQRSIDEKLAEKLDGKYKMASRYTSTWSRIKKLVITIGDQIFYGNQNPFMIQKNVNGKKERITTVDLAFLTLFSLYMLIEECWKNNILLLGITKDTAANDFKGHVIPICIRNNIWGEKCSLTQQDFESIPGTDRMFLQSLSMFNHDKMSIPWASIEYDAAFLMAVPDLKKRNGYVSGASKNKISPSYLFLRSFVQLSKSKRDSMLRSNVLSIDRLVYPDFDLSTNQVITELIHEYIVNEPIRFLLFKTNKTKNAIQNHTSTSENAPISAKYDCRVKVVYHKDIMSLVEEGMIMAVKNFKTKLEQNNDNDTNRYTLLVASRVWPDHYGLRAISEHTYYPMQFEVIEQSVTDWDTDDKSTMMIQISTIPVNYDLIISKNKGTNKNNGSSRFDDYCRYVKGFSYPLIGDAVYLLNADTVSEMYNRRVLEKMNWNIEKTSPHAKQDPRIGIIKMFEGSEDKIPIYVNFDNLIRYHFGIFSFTGGGKSNLLSNILRRILIYNQDTKIVIFDISSEYPFLLMDLFADSNIQSKIILESPVKSADQFYISVVKPREYEDDDRAKSGLSKIYDRGIITHFIKPQSEVPRCADILADLISLKNESAGKPHYINAIDDIYQEIVNYMSQNELVESQYVDEAFVHILCQVASEAMETYKISEKAGLYAWAGSRDKLRDRIKLKKDKNESGVTTEQIRDIIEGGSRLTSISISDPYTIKELVIDLTSSFIQRRKRQFQTKPYILFVFDEAQEFVRDMTSARGIEKECSEKVETLLRQGRKYGLGGCIATQRIAYLNTNALQQLHTYFVGTLPRPYDRNLVSNTFTIDQGILEKTLEFGPGEWLLSSYIATGIENIPIFIKADNAEKEIESFITGT